jgi:hypothetical protein
MTGSGVSGRGTGLYAIENLCAGKRRGDFGAGDRIRTGDINLGKVALYQLSYSRVRGDSSYFRLPETELSNCLIFDF